MRFKRCPHRFFQQTPSTSIMLKPTDRNHCPQRCQACEQRLILVDIFFMGSAINFIFDVA